MHTSTTAVILAAGMGTRMKSRFPKAMQRLACRPMISHLIETAEKVVDTIMVVVGPDMTDLEKTVAPHHTVLQKERLGTGHAALTAIQSVTTETVVFLYADNPLLTETTLRTLITRYTEDAKLSLLGMRPEYPGHYGRLIEAHDGTIQRIVEYKDATEEERSLRLCNAGMMCARTSDMVQWLSNIKSDNAQGEYYLTDVVELAAQQGSVYCVEGSEDELAGINSRHELAKAEAHLQHRLRQNALDQGVTFVDPNSVFLCTDTTFGTDVTIEPNVVFGPHVTVKDGCTIRAFSHLEGCLVEEESIIGPYARLRPGTHCKKHSHVGNFVELKNTTLGEESKANHLTYLGDASIGDHVNIGAGSITCNYDGVFKHKTTIGAKSFIGSNSILVAPVTIGDDTVVAAGSVITENVPARAMSLGRSKQINKAERGSSYKNSLKAKKEQG